MLRPNSVEQPPPEQSAASAEVKDGKPAEKPPRRGRWAIVLLVIVALLIGARLAMAPVVRWYVNRTIDQSPMYKGRIGDIHIHLWRGAYSIDDVRLNKITGNVPVPLYAAKRVDFAIQWDALLHGKIVGRVLMDRPELNFVDAPDDSQSQSGGGGPWLKMIRDLFPFKINAAIVKDGSVHFRAYQTKEPVDVYLSHLDAEVQNLTNIRDEVTPLVTTVKAKALAMDQAKFEYEMKMDPFSYYPTFQMAVRLVGLDVTKTNSLVRSYGKFDFERGFFDLVVEMESREGRLDGYVKPLFRHLKILGPADFKEDNILELFWEALVGGVTKLLTNQQRDQFGTKIPITGDVTGTKPDILATIGNVLRNAFIRAYMPRLEGQTQDLGGIEFGPATAINDVPGGEVGGGSP